MLPLFSCMLTIYPNPLHLPGYVCLFDCATTIPTALRRSHPQGPYSSLVTEFGMHSRFLPDHPRTRSCNLVAVHHNHGIMPVTHRLVAPSRIFSMPSVDLPLLHFAILHPDTQFRIGYHPHCVNTLTTRRRRPKLPQPLLRRSSCMPNHLQLNTHG